MSVALGIFVGGSGTRMGGLAKGLLTAPAGDKSLLARLLGVCRVALPSVTPVLVGRAAAYFDFGLASLDDEPAGVGPIGGLRALLNEARRTHAERVLALACDLPFIDAELLTRLNLPLNCAARVPIADGRWQPLAAAYATEPTRIAVEAVLGRGQRALMCVLDQLGPDIERLEGDAAFAQTLRDWDTPEDLLR